MSAVAAAAAPPLGSPSAGLAVTVRGVERRYRNGRGLGPVDLDVRAGETLALLGRNGCGKTTLLRILGTVARPRCGTVSWFAGGAAAARAHLGLALDGALEDGGLTGRQATHFWCAQWVRDRGEVAARTRATLARLGLAGAADDPVATYSFGMRRRLALAGALAHEPRLALLDEPTAGLDPEGCADLVAILAERAGRGLSSVVASNEPAFVEAAADRVAVLDEGRVVRVATPAELLGSLPPGRVAEVVLAGSVDAAALRGVPGVTSVTVDGQAAIVRFDRDDSIAALVAAADGPGGRLRELRLRRPGLGDCFRELTGRPLEEPR